MDFSKFFQIQPIIHQEIQPVITTEIQPIITQKIQPVVYKEIQPIIHHEIQPVITREIQPIITNKIQPVVHKEIQPIIHEEIQPVITTEIQPIINKKIQPVIFMENQTNIEEIIEQLEHSHKQNSTFVNKREVEIVPMVERKVQNSEKIVIKPYIMREECHITKKEIAVKNEKINEYIEIVEYVPYIQYKNGNILPYEKKEKKTINTSYQIMETIIAVNFISLNYDIHYPMACRKTDIFSKIEEKLYREFPILKSKQIFFVSNGNVIDRDLTFEQNKIKSGNSILINEMEK